MKNRFWQEHDKRTTIPTEPDLTWEEIKENDKKPCTGDWSDYEQPIDTEGTGAP